MFIKHLTTFKVVLVLSGLPVLRFAVFALPHALCCLRLVGLICICLMWHCVGGPVRATSNGFVSTIVNAGAASNELVSGEIKALLTNVPYLDCRRVCAKTPYQG